jgi:hypothetical protein
MKATLQIDAPESCDKCDISYYHFGEHETLFKACAKSKFYVDTYVDSRHPSCPLQIEEKQGTKYQCERCDGIFIAARFEIPEYAKCSFCGAEDRYHNFINEV